MTTLTSTDWSANGPTHALAVVSYRLPIINTAGCWERAPGGLVSALTPALEHTKATWFGRLDSARLPPARSMGTNMSIVAISTTPEERHLAIDGFCNRTLWPALHGLTAFVEQRTPWWTAYQQMNTRTAAVVAQSAPPHAKVWIHDFQNFGVARPLRRLRPDLTVGLYCHTPIDAANLAKIDQADGLRELLAAHHLVGTQTQSDADNLIDFLGDRCLRHPPEIAAMPVGFDVERWRDYRHDPAVRAIALQHGVPRGILAVGIDRIDYTKGLTPKLLAVEHLLNTGGLEPDNFRLVQIAVPSRATIPAYRDLDAELRQIAARINTNHLRVDQLPVVDLRHGQHTSRELAGVLRAADLALVTPTRDGMNLVALEASVVNQDRPFEVVLSARAGAAEHIGQWSELVSTADVESIAHAIHRALPSPSGNSARSLWRSRHRAAAAALLSTDQWTRQFLAALDTSSQPRSIPNETSTPPEQPPRLSRSLVTAP